MDGAGTLGIQCAASQMGDLMADGPLVLMAVEPLPPGDWLHSAHSVLNAAGMFTSARNTEILVWKDRRRYRSMNYSDGWLVRRLWLSPRRGALAVTSRRIYFIGDSAEPDRTPEHILVPANRPPSPSAAEELDSQWMLIRALADGLGATTKPVDLQRIDSDLKAARSVRIGSNAYLSPPATLNALYREHGFDETPNNFRVTVCPLESVSEMVANRFVNKLRQANSQRNVDGTVRLANVIEITQRLTDMKRSGHAVATGRCVLFILPSQHEKPRPESLSLIATLEAAGIPFRRAYADDPVDFSIPDQLPSLVIAAGGRPHRSPAQVPGAPVWTVGVDLSHPVDSPFSILALTLVDPDGGLAGAWTRKQARDETVRGEALAVMLDLCRARLASCDQSPRVMILRDGRMFENEDSGLYRRGLGAPVSLFEYRKRGNPQIVRPGGVHASPREPLAVMLPGASTMFVVTATPRTEHALPSVAKVTWRPDWNGLDLDPPAIGRLLAASATAPGLGLQPRHLPAAIYWADGIAGASDGDLRFRGVPVQRAEIF